METAQDLRTYHFNTNMPVSLVFPKEFDKAIYGSLKQSIDMVGKISFFLNQDNYRNVLYLLYNFNVNYKRNLMRILKVSKDSIFTIMRDLKNYNLITEVSDSANQEVVSFFNYFCYDLTVKHITTAKFYALTPWCRDLISEMLPFFETNIMQSVVEEVISCRQAMEKHLSEINQKKAELDEKRAIALAEPLLTDGEIIWFENFGAEFVSDKSNRKKLCKEYNRKFDTELTTGDLFGSFSNFDTKVSAYLQTKGIELFDEESFEIINPKKIQV